MQKFIALLNELRSTNSSNEKKAILAKYPECKKHLNYVLDPFKMFGVTSGNLEKFPITLGNTGAVAPFDLLDKLSSRKLTGHDALKAIQDEFEDILPSDFEAFKCFLDKDLKCGVGAELVNKVFPGLIPEFKVQLCKSMEDYVGIPLDLMTKLPYEVNYVSRKLDGCRLLTIIEGNDIHFYSREGREFLTLDVLKKDLKNNFPVDKNVSMVLDGEICLMDGEKEDFKGIVSELKRKDHTIKNPKYKIIDSMILKDFQRGFSSESFRNAVLGNWHRSTKSSHFEFEPQILIETVGQLKLMFNRAMELGWEGLIIRDGNLPYKAKRHNGILKIKKFHDAELKITGVYEGEGNFKGMLGGFTLDGVIDGKEIHTDMGSGFTEAERIGFWEDPGSLVGREVTVKYFEISKNKEGGYSLRFPIFKGLYVGKRDI